MSIFQKWGFSSETWFLGHKHIWIGAKAKPGIHSDVGDTSGSQIDFWKSDAIGVLGFKPAGQFTNLVSRRLPGKRSIGSTQVTPKLSFRRKLICLKKGHVQNIWRCTFGQKKMRCGVPPQQNTGCKHIMEYSKVHPNQIWYKNYPELTQTEN